MVKMVSVDDIVKDEKGRNTIKGPAAIDGPSAFKMVHGAVARDLMTLKLPFTANKFICTKNQELVDKCLGLKKGLATDYTEEYVDKVEEVIEDGVVTDQEKKEIQDIVNKYVDKV